MQPALLLEHYRVPLDECASEDGSTPWRRHPEQLGRGAHGEVWLEENAIEGKLRAVKTVRKLASRRYVNNEVEAFINLSQRRYRPLFGEFLGYHENAHTISFFMEYFPNSDLRKYLPQCSGLPEFEAQSIIRQILHGVKAMHENDFVHRDLKPENIFVVSRAPWRVKIGDFGVTKRFVGSTTTRVGTEQYMAPEMLLSVSEGDKPPGNYSDAVDIWSTGIIAYELLTGERPFVTHAKLKGHCDGRYSIASTLELNSISNEGIEFVQELLQPQPLHRPSAAAALTEPWLSDHQAPLRSASYALPERSLSSASVPPERPLPQVPSLGSFSKPISPRFQDEGYCTTSQYSETSEDILDFAMNLASNVAPPVPTPSRRDGRKRVQSLVQALQEDDVVTKIIPLSPTPDVIKPESPRPISVISSGSNKSASAEIRHAISQRLASGQWKANRDVVVSCHFQRWDLQRIAGYMISSTEPLVLFELLHKNYVEEIPMLVFKAIKPWLEEQLYASKLVKTLTTNAKSYAQKIRDNILPDVDLYGPQPEYYMLTLPRTAEVVDITQVHVQGDAIQVPSKIIISTIKEHWKRYNEEYVKGFMYNEHVTLNGKLRVRAVVFDESASKHERLNLFLQDRLMPKLGPDMEYFTFDGFREFADRTSKKLGKDDDVKPSRKWRLGRR